MKVRIQVVIEHEDGHETQRVEEVGCLQRGDLLPETLGIDSGRGQTTTGERAALSGTATGRGLHCSTAKLQRVWTAAHAKRSQVHHDAYCVWQTSA